MNDNILEVVDEVISPDEWAAIDPSADRAAIRAMLEHATAEFLKHGGKIQQAEQGASTAVPTRFNLPAICIAAFDPAQQKRHKADQAKLTTIRSSQDKAAVAVLDKLLGTPHTTCTLAAAMGCSVDKVQRLVRDYFPDDLRADPYRKRTREESREYYEKTLLEKIKQAQAEGVRGIWEITKYCNANYANVAAVNKKLKLGLVLAKGDNRKPQPEIVKRKYVGKLSCGHCDGQINGSCHYCPHCGFITAKGLEKEKEEA